MVLPVERNFRRGRIWYKQFYNPLADASTYHDKVVGKHHLRGVDKPGELAMLLEE